MISLIASIGGFLSSMLPEILKYFKDVNDKNHELEIFQKQIEFNKIQAAHNLEEIHVSRDVLEQASLYSTFTSNIVLIDILNGSVRPILAYSFFILYISVKYIQYNAILKTDNVVEYLDILWSIDDQAIFAGIISFYFGQRTFRNVWRRK